MIPCGAYDIACNVKDLSLQGEMGRSAKFLDTRDVKLPEFNKIVPKFYFFRRKANKIDGHFFLSMIAGLNYIMITSCDAVSTYDVIATLSLHDKVGGGGNVNWMSVEAHPSIHTLSN